MGSPSYLLKKQDTYYFRQAWPSSVKSKIGRREIVKSLGVKEKSLAVRMAREFKVNLDHIIDHLIVNPLTDTSAATDFLDQSLSKIKVKYKLHQKDRSNYVQEIETLPATPPTEVDQKENIIVAPSPFISTNKTKIIPLFAKYSSEKTRLKQWSPKSLKERISHLIYQ